MNIDAIVTTYEPGAYGVSSPQVPALFAGSDNLADYSPTGVSRLLLEAGAPEGFDLRIHRQAYSWRRDREWFIRVFADPAKADHRKRLEVLAAFRRLLDATPEPIDSAAKATTGEATFVICLPTDTLGDLTAQMLVDEVVTIVAPFKDGLGIIDLRKADEGGEGWEALDETMTVASVMRHVLMTPTTAESPTDFLSEDELPHVNRGAQQLLLMH